MDASDEAQVLKINMRVPRANWMPIVRAHTHFIGEHKRVVVLDSTRAFVSQRNVSESSSTVVAICYAVDSADRGEVVGTVGDQSAGIFREFEYTDAFVIEDGSRFVEGTTIWVCFVVGSANGSVAVGTVGQQRGD